MKDKNEQTLSVLRLLMSAIKNKAIEKGIGKDEAFNDAEVIKIIKSQIKQLKDAVGDFEKAGRDDLAEQNKKEIEVLSRYLPEEMGEDEIKKAIDQKIAEMGEVTMQDFGKVMGAVMQEVGDSADGAKVKEILQKKLSS